MKKTNLFAILALAATPAFLHAQTTNFSDIVGYTTLNVRAKSGSANAFSYISLNVHRPTALRSVVGTKSLNGSGQSVVAVSSTLTANQFSGTSNKHYVRVTSGVNTGLISEIVSNDTSSITLADNLDAVLENGVTKFEVRPYWTLATAFPSGAGLKAGTSSTAADNVTIIDPATGTGNSYFYNSSASQWRRGTTDSSSIIIPPGSGIMVTRKDVTAVAIQISGEVITSSV
ncbi:MAG: TIGR02597 family protein, partial [Bacteroidetes bacterium]|nr:TIGR02597 family protein [Bacteroidota bacterium]